MVGFKIKRNKKIKKIKKIQILALMWMRKKKKTINLLLNKKSKILSLERFLYCKVLMKVVKVHFFIQILEMEIEFKVMKLINID